MLIASSGVVWDYASLDGFLERPNRYMSGTNMNFIGLKKPEDRAAVIEYLRQAADAPIPQPEVAMVEVTVPAEEIVVEADPSQDAPAPEAVEQ